MFVKLFFLACALAAVLAYPYPEDKKPDVPYQSPLQLQGGGGGSRKQGFDVSIDGRAPVYKSDNGNHEFGVSGGYSQHLGGPYGNSQPDKRVGLDYTYRFKG